MILGTDMCVKQKYYERALQCTFSPSIEKRHIGVDRLRTSVRRGPRGKLLATPEAASIGLGQQVPREASN